MNKKKRKGTSEEVDREGEGEKKKIRRDEEQVAHEHDILAVAV
jgi:hypothetical protein